MKNKIIMFICGLMCFLTLGINAYADDPIHVTLNGAPVQYAATDAQPVIYNSRAMVPIRSTAEILGLKVDWDKETETATFTNADGSRVIKHTMRSNIIYINGTFTSFDTSSIVMNDHILMPIRMLAEAMGAVVTWDNPSRTVIIQTTAASTDPAIESVQAVNPQIKQGDEASIVCVTNNSTTKVKLHYASTGKDVKEFTDFVDNANNTRTFTLNFVPEDDKTANKLYYVYPGNDTAYFEFKSVNLTVNEDSSSDKSKKDENDNGLSEYIKSAEIENDDDIYEDDYIDFSVVTTTDIERIKVETSFSSSPISLSNYSETGSKRTFRGRTKVTSSGSCHLYIYVYPKDLDKFTTDYRSISFKVYKSNETERDEKLTIFEVNPTSDITTKDEQTELYVFTSPDIDYIEVLNDEDDLVAKTSSPYEEFSSQNVFTVNWKERVTGNIRYKVVAYNKDDESTSENVRINCKNEDDGPFIISISPERDNIESGKETTYNIRCSSDTENIVIKNNNNKTLFSNDSISKSSGSNYKRTSARITIGDVNTYYTIQAYDKDGDVFEKNFYVYGTTYEEPEITDLDYESTVYEGDSFDVKVYTSKSVSRVWIEDEDEDKITNTLKSPSRETTDEYIWDFSFTPDDEGNRVYTVYASNEDDVSKDEEDYDTRSIKVKVK